MIDDYRGADEALDGRPREAAEGIDRAKSAEKAALEAGVAVQPADLRPEYDRLAGEVASRAAHRDEFNPRRELAAVEALVERAKERQTALEDEVSSKARMEEARRTARTSAERARGVLKEYRRSYADAEDQWGPAGLESAPAPEGLSSKLHDAANLADEADRLEAAGRFAEARSRLDQAGSTAKTVVDAPAALRAAVVEADRKKREGEEKLRELETRLEQAKANEHLMSPRQRERLGEYEYQLRNARSGFSGATGSPSSSSSRPWTTSMRSWTVPTSRRTKASGTGETPVATGVAMTGAVAAIGVAEETSAATGRFIPASRNPTLPR